jgi:hypothetical protein
MDLAFEMCRNGLELKNKLSTENGLSHMCWGNVLPPRAAIGIDQPASSQPVAAAAGGDFPQPF